MDESRKNSRVVGLAAMSLLEAIILTLLERDVLTADEIDDAFEAAINAHRNSTDPDVQHDHRAVVAILERLRVHGNSVRLDNNAAR